MAEQKLTRYRNKVTGSVVRVDDQTAETLGGEYEKASDAPAKKPRGSASASR